MEHQTETYYPILSELLALDSSDGLAIIGIIVSIGVGLLVWRLDVRRNTRIENDHKKIIRSNMDEINEIVTQILLDVDELEKDEESVSIRLNKFLVRNYNHIEFMINNIKLHQAQCSDLSTDEINDIENAIKVSRWILDKYCPQDVPEPRRVNLWKKYDPELKNQATLLSDSVTHFIN